MKKLLLALTFTALASVPLVHADKAGEQDPSGKSHGKKPNIVFILADDLGWTDLSTGETNLGNGSDFYETPNIDALAKSGISFTSAYMQPNCAPTRAALISGQYPARDGNGVYNVVSLKDGWKLVHWMNQNETELYILADDVGERNDLSQAQPQRTREMLATLNEWVKETRQKK